MLLYAFSFISFCLLFLGIRHCDEEDTTARRSSGWIGVRGCRTAYYSSNSTTPPTSPLFSLHFFTFLLSSRWTRLSYWRLWSIPRIPVSSSGFSTCSSVFCWWESAFGSGRFFFYFNESYAVASSNTVSALGVMDEIPLRAKLKYLGYGDVFYFLLNWPYQYLLSQIETLVRRDGFPFICDLMTKSVEEDYSGWVHTIMTLTSTTHIFILQIISCWH